MKNRPILKPNKSAQAKAKGYETKPILKPNKSHQDYEIMYASLPSVSTDVTVKLSWL